MYKKENIVMLPSNQKAIYHGQPWLHGNKLHYHTGSVDGVTEQEITSGYCVPQHLYVLSDDEIKEGDWRMNFILGKAVSISKQESNSYAGFISRKPHLSDKKIIAATSQLENCQIPNPSGQMYLPQIPLSFIQYFVEQYNKGNIITKIDIEYEQQEWISEKTGLVKKETADFEFVKQDRFLVNNILKINTDNTINIKPIKDNFDINDIYKALKDKSCLADKKSMDEWIQRNL